jgi:hypothetical protein
MRRRNGLVVLALAVAAGALFAAVAGAAAGPRVQTSAARTVSCTTDEGAMQFSAFATNPMVKSANVTISTGNPNSPNGLLGVSSEQPKYGLAARCHSVANHVVLSHRGLTSAGVVHAGDVRSPAVYCAATSRVLLRLLVSYSSAGKPVSAAVEALTQPKPRGGKTPVSKRIGFVQWSPKRSVTYYATSACRSQY